MDWIGSRALLNVHKFTHTYVGGVFCLFFVTRILRVGVQIFILSRCGLFTIKSHIFAILKTVCNRNKYAWSYSLSSFWVLSLGVQWVQIVQIFSLSVWVVHHQIIFLPFFFLPRNQNPTLFFPTSLTQTSVQKLYFWTSYFQLQRYLEPSQHRRRLT